MRWLALEDDDCMFVRDLANASYMASPCRSAGPIGFWSIHSPLIQLSCLALGAPYIFEMMQQALAVLGKIEGLEQPEA